VSSKQLRSLKDVVEQRASELNVAPEMLAKRRHLEQLVRSKEAGQFALPNALQGWREDVIGDVLLEAAASLST
jgi:ribonuclease D